MINTFYLQKNIPAPLQWLKGKSITIILFFSLLPVLVKAQTVIDVSTKFAKVIAGAGYKEIKSLGTDAAGNTYVAGLFEGTVDFDPGVGVQNLTSAGSTDIFFAKYSSTGAYVFAKRIGGAGGDAANSMDVDSAGNIYLAGNFRGAPDFDPGVESQNLVSYIQTSADIFFAKYNSNGGYIFANSIGGLDNDRADLIKADAAGNIYMAGRIENEVDFGRGPGIRNFSVGPGACYFAKYDARGNLDYVKKFDAGVRFIKSILPDADGNLLIAGEFKDRVDFDMGEGFAELNCRSNISFDIFIVKYNITGKYLFAKAISGTLSKNVGGMAVDLQGNILLTGQFLGTADFNPSDRTQNLVAQGVDIFFAKYSPAGEYIFARQIGGTDSDEGNGVATDSSGNIYAAGRFRGTVDFDPDVNTQNLVSNAGTSDVFVASYDVAGNFIFASKIGGSGAESLNQLITDRKNNIYLAGTFTGRTNLAACPTGNIDATSVSNSADAFFTRIIKTDIRQTAISVLSNTNCKDDPITLSIASKDINPNLDWFWYSDGCSGTPIGIGNSINIKSAAGNNIFYVKGRSKCGLFGPCATLVYVNNKPATTNNSFSIKSISGYEICEGTTVTITTKTDGAGANPVYKWFKNSNDANVSTATYTDSTLKDGDILHCKLTSSILCAVPQVANSNSISFTVVKRGVPQITLSSDDMANESEGGPIVIKATVTNAGTNSTLSFLWEKNGVKVGANIPEFKDSFKSGDQISCTLSSSLSCLAKVNRVMRIQYKKY